MLRRTKDGEQEGRKSWAQMTYNLEQIVSEHVNIVWYNE
ncbi:hypothetical protein B2K_01965 [Paenibacillus mucilaginosus K02]|uniref:Uncharacterized protein n=1 Tax=Paenibacillus mucilaginosus K02 TaxID=997761 RepID=I0BAV5_9BACL|nr:hypothetical protein B2K_01965 [Paenibacillus mucilaginosus K02]